MRRVQTSKFPVLSIYYTPTELGVGPQRNESCTAISATCNETRDWLAWTIGLRYLVVSRPDPFRKIEKGSGHETSYLHAVVSICEYTVSNKGGLPCHCLGDCVGAMPPLLIFCGAAAPTAARPPPLLPGSTAYGLQIAISEHAQLHTLVVGVTTS